ncbi:MAG: hypothetical protein IT424_03475 [Pirellulales bacterium]|nr:hypothetical protein [Pirellulales bacterium]
MAVEEYEIHPAANIFPMMPAAELQELADDIRVNGQREPIVYFQGKLLDGRNRVEACAIAGVEPDACEIDEEDIAGNKFDAVAYVLSTNLHRRHLDESQRAMIGLEVEKYHATLAKERQREAGGDRRAKALVALLPPAPEKGRSRDKAAAAVGVSPRLVSFAKRVAQDGAPELAAAVSSGKVSVSVAAKLAKAVPDKERQAEAVIEALACNTHKQADAVLNRAVSGAAYQTRMSEKPTTKADSSPTPARLGEQHKLVDKEREDREIAEAVRLLCQVGNQIASLRDNGLLYGSRLRAAMHGDDLLRLAYDKLPEVMEFCKIVARMGRGEQ